MLSVLRRMAAANRPNPTSAPMIVPNDIVPRNSPTLGAAETALSPKPYVTILNVENPCIVRVNRFDQPRQYRARAFGEMGAAALLIDDDGFGQGVNLGGFPISSTFDIGQGIIGSQVALGRAAHRSHGIDDGDLLAEEIPNGRACAFCLVGTPAPQGRDRGVFTLGIDAEHAALPLEQVRDQHGGSLSCTGASHNEQMAVVRDTRREAHAMIGVDLSEQECPRPCLICSLQKCLIRKSL